MLPIEFQSIDKHAKKKQAKAGLHDFQLWIVWVDLSFLFRALVGSPGTVVLNWSESLKLCHLCCLCCNFSDCFLRFACCTWQQSGRWASPNNNSGRGAAKNIRANSFVARNTSLLLLFCYERTKLCNTFCCPQKYATIFSCRFCFDFT